MAISVWCARITIKCVNTHNADFTEHWLKLMNYWLHPDMTEKLLTGTLNHSTNKQNTHRACFDVYLCHLSNDEDVY